MLSKYFCSFFSQIVQWFFSNILGNIEKLTPGDIAPAYLGGERAREGEDWKTTYVKIKILDALTVLW